MVLFPISSLSVAWESSQEQSKTLRPCTCVGDPEVSGSWLWIGFHSIAATPLHNQQMEDLLLCLSSSLYNWLSSKKKERSCIWSWRLTWWHTSYCSWQQRPTTSLGVVWELVLLSNTGHCSMSTPSTPFWIPPEVTVILLGTELYFKEQSHQRTKTSKCFHKCQ